MESVLLTKRSGFHRCARAEIFIAPQRRSRVALRVVLVLPAWATTPLPTRLVVKIDKKVIRPGCEFLRLAGGSECSLLQGEVDIGGEIGSPPHRIDTKKSSHHPQDAIPLRKSGMVSGV